MIRERNGFIQIIVVLAIALIVFLVLLLIFPKSQPIIGVETNINPQKFKTTQQSVLTLSLTNNDQTNAHTVELRFVTNYLVHIYIGASELAHQESGSGNYTYNTTLQPAQKTEQPFIVKVTGLPIGIASQEFSITVEVYVDARLTTTQKVRFTVEEA